MNQHQGNAVEHTFSAIFALALVVAIFRIASWVISGVYDLVTAIFWGIAYLVIGFVALIVFTMFLCVLAWIQERWKERQDFLSALGRAEFPTKASFLQGIGLNGAVSHIFVTVLRELYIDKFGPPPRRMGCTEFSYLKFKLFRLALKKQRYRAIIEQEVYSPLLSLWNSGSNETLSQWVKEAISNERRRKFFFLVSILLHTLSSAITFGKFTIGYSSDPENLFYYRDAGELRSSQTQFFRFMWKHGLPNLRLISQILGCSPLETPEETVTIAPAPENKRLSAPTEAAAAPNEAEIIEADFTDFQENQEDNTLQFEQEAIEQFKDAKARLFYDCPEWGDDPETHLMTLGDTFDDLIVEGFYPNPDDCEDLLLIVDQALTRLPYFDQAFEACMSLEPDEAFKSPWMMQTSAEFNSGEIQVCLSAFRRVAVRCFVLATDPLPTTAIPVTDETAIEAEPASESKTPAQSDVTFSDPSTINHEANNSDFSPISVEKHTQASNEPEIASEAPQMPSNGIQKPLTNSMNAPIGF